MPFPRIPALRPRFLPVSRPRALRTRAAALAVIASVVPAAAVQAQATATTSPPTSALPQRLDEGSFTIVVRGQRVGREQFSVHQLKGADGTALELRAESATGDRRTAMRLEADSAGTPMRYTLEERQGTEQTLRLGGQRVRGRFTTLARSLTGEAAREYLLRPGAVVVEEDGLIQHALFVRQPLRMPGDGVTRPSLTPAANSQGAVHIVLESIADTVTIAGGRRMAQRWRVVTASSEVRLVWADPDGHLLRISIPARGLDARRDDVPR